MLQKEKKLSRVEIALLNLRNKIMFEIENREKDLSEAESILEREYNRKPFRASSTAKRAKKARAKSENYFERSERVKKELLEQFPILASDEGEAECFTIIFLAFFLAVLLSLTF